LPYSKFKAYLRKLAACQPRSEFALKPAV